MNLVADFRQSHFPAFFEGISGVAIRAAQVAGGEPDENARQTCECAFALQTQVDFVDDQCVGHAVFSLANLAAIQSVEWVEQAGWNGRLARKIRRPAGFRNGAVLQRWCN